VSYKQSGVSEKELEKNLTFLRKEIEKLWNQTFIYFLDADSEKPADELVKIFKAEIQKSDLFFCFINHKKPSEWQLLELWMAYAMNKQVILYINEDVKDNYYLTYWMANHIFYFKNLKKDLKKVLG
jgi:hypothetical protein